MVKPLNLSKCLNGSPITICKSSGEDCASMVCGGVGGESLGHHSLTSRLVNALKVVNFPGDDVITWDGNPTYRVSNN